MFGLLSILLTALSSLFRTRAPLQLENLALRHQLSVLHRSVKRPKLTAADRLFWAVRSLERMAIRPPHREAGNRHCLASERLPAVLDTGFRSVEGALQTVAGYEEMHARRGQELEEFRL